MRPPGRTLPKSTDKKICTAGSSPAGTSCFSLPEMMSLFRLPCGKLSLAFLAVPAGKDGRVECPCQTVDDFIGVRGSVCGLFLFVQTHAPLIVPPWQSRARKSKFQFLSGARARMFSPCTCGWWLIDGLQVSVCYAVFSSSRASARAFSR